MLKSKFSLVVAILVVIYVSCITKKTDNIVDVNYADIPPNIEDVRAFLEAQDFANNPNWFLFPKADGTPGADKLKRLGLPVHGRWVKTYVNSIANDYLIKAINKEVAQPLDFPPGSFIVKQNYRSNPASPDVISPDESLLAVITLLYKPDPKFDYCVTGHIPEYNGKDCYGGDWFYGFYFLKEPAPGLGAQVQANVNTFCVNCHAPGFNTDYVRTLDNILNPFAQYSTTPYCDRFIENPPPLNPLQPDDKLAKLVNIYIDDTAISPNMPVDVPADPNKVFAALGPEKTQAMFDSYAWKSFIALNWPNKGPNPNTGNPQRGQANTDLPFTANKDEVTVWETYKPTFEVFQPGDVNWDPVNQPWNQKQPQIKGGGCQSIDHDFVITMGSKTRDVANETGQAFAGTFGYLVDQDSTRVRYEVLFNRTEFEYLISNGRAATVNLTPAGPKDEVNKVNFPDTKDDRKYQEGAMEIKSAWKKLCLDKSCNHQDADSYEAAQEKFLVRKVLVYDAESETCHIDTMALVGLHIARKTYFAPQWIWITFEHKDNVPDAGQSNPTGTFYNPHLKELDNCDMLPFLAPDKAISACPNVDLNRFVEELKNAPNQLTRLVPIDKVAQQMNQAFQTQLSKINSAFANYILVDTQWPLNGRGSDGLVNKFNCKDNGMGDDCFTSKPRFLRNSVIESYMSTYCQVGDNIGQFSNRSCMSCHGTAGADLSYVWLDAVSQRVSLVEK